VRRAAHRHEHDPLARLRRRGGSPHDVDDVADEREPGDRYATACLQPFPIDVRLRVEESRNDRPPAQIDASCRRRRARADLVGRSHGDDAPVVHRDGLGDRRPPIERDDGAALENQTCLGPLRPAILGSLRHGSST
jgi:hypothetical protein